MEFEDEVEYSEDLAEIIGLMMGDGGLYLDRRNRYQTTVAFNKREKNYLIYVKKLFEDLFDYKFCISELKDEFLLRNCSFFVGNYLIKSGIKCGNKVKNKIVVPDWVLGKKAFLLRFVRGFFDTDGCVYCKYNNYAQIQIKLGCKETLSSIKDVLVRLDFNPTRIQGEYNKGYLHWKLYLTRQAEIKKFFEEVKPMNDKHYIRYQKIIKWGCPDSNRNLVVSSD